jgi:hypothetical protein
MSSPANNPLLSSQREKSGSETASKYAYQYHWALYRAIQEHGLQKEYAIFVELHEDVVVSDSLDASTAKFQFNQVKTTKKVFTKKVLINIDKKKKNTNSILGKLISSYSAKPFAASVSELNLISVSGFGLKLKTPGVALTKITLPDLDATELSEVALAIKNELNVTPLPNIVQFIIPELPDKNFENYIIAEISKLISNLHAGSNYNSFDIYRILIDELNRKGAVTYDFAKWGDLITNKALTSITVTKVINQYTNLKDEAKIEFEFGNIVNEMNLKVMERRSLKKSFDRYRQERIGNKTVSQLDTTNSIKTLLLSNTSTAKNDINILLELVQDTLDQRIKNNFPSDQDLRAAIICEYIMGDS